MNIIGMSSCPQDIPVQSSESSMAMRKELQESRLVDKRKSSISPSPMGSSAENLALSASSDFLLGIFDRLLARYGLCSPFDYTADHKQSPIECGNKVFKSSAKMVYLAGSVSSAQLQARRRPRQSTFHKTIFNVWRVLYTQSFKH